ncbi:hypothetical protein PR202_ga29322 [Eleusine coracana subsp. coracana]|uniref:Uncharacterized protein n=1 Tax=Eleusine coracana subsp. coracana TaxID=191504 RepID=A0AAV5DL13_ELECO|nr:hypothetical protein PR202_ga29322 [Eleusine coracana subsp. coracana]
MRRGGARRRRRRPRSGCACSWARRRWRPSSSRARTRAASTTSPGSSRARTRGSGAGPRRRRSTLSWGSKESETTCPIFRSMVNHGLVFVGRFKDPVDRSAPRKESAAPLIAVVTHWPPVLRLAVSSASGEPSFPPSVYVTSLGPVIFVLSYYD